MPFTVDDFEDLLRLLYERPEWQERLRRAILPPELFNLPRLVEELVEVNRAERERVARLEAEQQATRQELREGFAQTGERLGHVESDLAAFRTETSERFDRVDERFDRVDERFDRVDEHLGRADQRLDTLEVRMRDLSTDMGDLKGRTLHAGYVHAPLLFDHLLPEPVALSRPELNTLLRAAIADGQMERGDVVRVLRTDIIFRAEGETPPRYLAVEVSWTIGVSDVIRAAERARLLSKLGRPALAAVAGRRIQPDAVDLASRRDVAVILDEQMDDRPGLEMEA
jgi:hypothetical protein